MRFAHFSDCHIHVPPSITDAHYLLSKRASGYLNLLLRRRHLLQAENNLYKLCRHIRSRNVDFVVFSGDISAIALPAEFLRAREIIYNSINPESLLIIPGNHDYYTFFSQKTNAFERCFSLSSKSDFPISKTDFSAYPKIRIVGNVLFLALNSARFNPLFFDASGRISQDQLRKASELLDTVNHSGITCLVLHHSLFLPCGRFDVPFHGLVNSRSVLRFCQTQGIHYILSGHIHRVSIVQTRSISQYNPGSAAQCGHFGYFLYESSDSGLRARFHSFFP